MNQQDVEIRRIRLRLIDLCKSFFVDKPDAEKLSRWRGTFSALTRETIAPGLDRAVREVNDHLAVKKLEDIQDEYYALFTDPFSEAHLNLMASHYFDNRNFGETLIRVRQLLADSDVHKVKTVVESEDSLPILLDLLGTFIEEENSDKRPLPKEMQAKLINDFLVPLTDKLIEISDQNESTSFYASCFEFIRGYLDLEKSMSGDA